MNWEEKGFTPLGPVKESKYIYKTYIKIFDEDALQALKRELKKYIGLQQGHIEVHDIEALRIEDDYTHEAFNYTLVEHGYCLHRQEIIFTDADFVYYKQARSGSG